MGAGEELGARVSPSDSAAEHLVPEFEQEEVGRKVRSSQRVDFVRFLFYPFLIRIFRKSV